MCIAICCSHIGFGLRQDQVSMKPLPAMLHSPLAGTCIVPTCILLMQACTRHAMTFNHVELRCAPLIDSLLSGIAHLTTGTPEGLAW